MKRTITTLLALLLGLIPISAQTLANPFELYVKAGAKEVAFKLGGNGDLKVDWGDGNIETITLSSSTGQTVSHTYAAPLATKTTVTIEATNVTLFKNETTEGGKSIVGVGIINAPLLEEFSFTLKSGGTLAESDFATVDFTMCPNLRSISLKNAPGIELGENTQLAKLEISSTGSKTPTYAQLSNLSLDLSPYKNLEEVWVSDQTNVKEINVTGLTKLTRFGWEYGALTSAIGLREITKSETLKELSLEEHNLPLSLLPARNPKVKYDTFSLTYANLQYVIPEENHKGAQIDLSAMSKEYDFEGKEHVSTITWSREGSTVMINNDQYDYQDGVFTFYESIFGTNEEDVVLQATITPSFFKLEDLVGFAWGSLKSNKVTFHKSDFKKPVGNSISFTTNKPAGSQLGLIVETKEGAVQLEGLEGHLLPNEMDYTMLSLTSDKVTIKGQIIGLWVKDETAGLTSIDVSNAPLLSKLYIGGNPELNSIDVSANTKLTKLYLANNSAITSLDVTGLNDLELIEVQQTGLTPVAMASLIATLPSLSGSWGADMIVQEKGVSNTVEVYKEDVAKAKEKNWKLYIADGVDVAPYEGIDKPAAPSTQLSFTTSKEVNTTISMQVEAAGEVTAEGLEPATIVVGGEEPTVYTLTAKNVVLKGEITGLKLIYSDLTDLDVSAMPSLEQINVGGNNFKKLDFSKNNALRSIIANWSFAENVTLPEEGGTLEELDLSGNSLKTIDLSPYTELNYCDLSYNDFETINLSSNESLEYLYLDSNKIKSLDLSKNENLSELAFDFNDLTTIDLSTLESLIYLSCQFNKLTSLDISHNTALKYLRASGNLGIATIDVTPCPELRRLSLMGLALTSLDLSSSSELRQLNIGNTKITTIDLSKLELLEEFNAGYTAMNAFDFSHNSELMSIFVADTKITSLSLPSLAKLQDLYLYSNALDPEEMERIIEQLPSIPAVDEDGNELHGLLVLQHTGENESLLNEKGFNPIKVYKTDVAKAKAKNWKLAVYVPGEYGKGEYKDYGEGIETSAERITQGKWHVSTSGEVATIVGAPEGESYALYSFEGSLIKRGTIHSAAEAIAMGSLAKGTYIVVVAGEAVAFVL